MPITKYPGGLLSKRERSPHAGLRDYRRVPYGFRENIRRVAGQLAILHAEPQIIEIVQTQSFVYIVVNFRRYFLNT